MILVARPVTDYAQATFRASGARLRSPWAAAVSSSVKQWFGRQGCQIRFVHILEDIRDQMMQI